MSDNPTKISRRRVLAGAGAGAAAVWIAPAVTTLSSASAAGSCAKGSSVFKFVAADVNNHGSPPNGAELTGLLSTPTGNLNVTGGNVDFVGPGTPFPPPTYPGVPAVDMTGGAGVTVTTLEGVSLPAGAYLVEMDVFGSIDGETGGNSAIVQIGATTVISTGLNTDTTASAFAFSGSTASASGTIKITHTSQDDFRGLFLNRLEVFTCL
jgi:hypothetical protein